MKEISGDDDDQDIFLDEEGQDYLNVDNSTNAMNFNLNNKEDTFSEEVDTPFDKEEPPPMSQVFEKKL